MLSLADFVAPQDAGISDHIGAFAITSGTGCEEHVARFEAAHDDYSAILLKALADRLAEAFAEYLHRQVRYEWGFGATEGELALPELINGSYRSIRPAPGYPACPNHEDKRQLFDSLDVLTATSMRLTETCAMQPAASVCGLYFHHPAARYFAVGPIGQDQIKDYASRRGTEQAAVERALGPNLAYTPSTAGA